MFMRGVDQAFMQKWPREIIFSIRSQGGSLRRGYRAQRDSNFGWSLFVSQINKSFQLKAQPVFRKPAAIPLMVRPTTSRSD